MKAAMEAAMELEGRLETVESTLADVQERIGSLEGNCARKVDVEGAQQQCESTRQNLLTLVAQKADEEQLGQCLQAVRFELTEAVKRKANSELLSSSLEELRDELTKAVADRASSEQLRQLAVDMQEKATKAVADRASSEQLRQLTVDMQEKITKGLAGKADSTDVDGRFSLLATKLESNCAESAGCREALAALEVVSASRERERADALPKLQEQICQQRREMEEAVTRLDMAAREAVTMLNSKADTTAFKDELEALKREVATKVDDEQLTVVRSEGMTATNMKADMEKLEQLSRRVQELEDLKVKGEQLEGRAKELEEGLAEVLAHKADREKVVEIVEAVRDEALDLVTRRADDVSSCLKEQREASQQLSEKFDAKLKDNLQALNKDLLAAVASKVDLDVLDKRAKALADELASDVGSLRHEFQELVDRKADVELVDQRLEVLLQRRRQPPPHGSSDGTVADPASQRKEEEVAEDRWDTAAFAPPQRTPRSRFDTEAASEWDEWWSQRMRLVRTELTKMVEGKADKDHVARCCQTVKQDVTQHVNQQVHAVQLDVTRQVEQQTQAVQKKLQAEVVQVQQSIQKVELNMSTLNQQDKQCGSNGSTRAPPSSRSGTTVVTDSIPEAEETAFDDPRALRVRELLKGLVIQPNKENSS